MGWAGPVQRFRGKRQIHACAAGHPPLLAQLPWACSSVVEHCVDIAGVASSILATPTIENPVKSTVWRGFCLHSAGREARPCPPVFGQILGKSGSLLANSGHANAGRWKRNPESRTPLKLSQTAGDVPTPVSSRVDPAAAQELSKRCSPIKAVAGRRIRAFPRTRAPPRDGYEHVPVARHAVPVQHAPAPSRTTACARPS